ncbi:MAG: hypothetical protein HY934_08140 [Candidatus Firestonebacteria bacterium]|nr:hypothetical protein [Candidatus Firestonebacteria bacterium]
MKLRNTLQIIFFILIVKPFLTVFIGLRVYGKKNISKNHPFIIIANHSSHQHELPDIIIANLMGLKEKEMFKVSEEEKKDVEVNINLPK